MNRAKNLPSSKNTPIKKVWKVLSIKRNSLQSQTLEISQTQKSDNILKPSQENDTINSSNSLLHEVSPRKVQIARKSTSTVMQHYTPESDSEDDTPPPQPVRARKELPGQRYVTYKAKDGSVKKRYAPGVRALKEIRFLQQSTQHAIPKAPFARLVREITQQITSGDFRFTVGSLIALHVSWDRNEKYSFFYKN